MRDVQFSDAAFLSFLGAVECALRNDPARPIVDRFIDDLDNVRKRSTIAQWRELAAVVRRHPIHSLLLEDPYTQRAFSKPRGYAGDAVMLDYVYGIALPGALSATGAAVWQATTGALSAEAVRGRRHRLATLIEARAIPGAVVTSVACGHAREYDLASSFAAQADTMFHAIDQDPQSLATMSTGKNLQPHRLGIRQLLSGAPAFSSNLIYSAGLFDYLDDATARALVQWMWRCVRPSGTLVLANFATDSGERGYMEAVMDWWLVYRTEAELAMLVQDLEGAARPPTIYRDATQRTVWLEISRA